MIRIVHVTIRLWFGDGRRGGRLTKSETVIDSAGDSWMVRALGIDVKCGRQRESGLVEIAVQ